MKNFVHDPHYREQRRKALGKLDINAIDAPIVPLINGLSKLPYCFTLQSCYGHFLYDGQKDPYNTQPLPVSNIISRVEYKIAYVALCLQNNDSGRALFQDLSGLVSIDPETIQFGCAEWFWERQVNSYVVQVEPERFKTKDRITVDYQEALHIEKVRNEFFSGLERMIEQRPQPNRA